MKKRSIIPAPAARVGYPRIGTVWRAFATGTLAGVAGLSGVAHADCALPEHTSTVDPSKTATKPAGKQAKKVDGTDGKGTTAGTKPAVPEPRRVMVTGGVVPATHPTPVPPDTSHVLGGVEAPVQHPIEKAPPPKPEPKPTMQIDGGISAVQTPARPMHYHPHGPDEPCRPAIAYVVLFDGEDRDA